MWQSHYFINVTSFVPFWLPRKQYRNNKLQRFLRTYLFEVTTQIDMGVSLLNTPPKFSIFLDFFWLAEPLKMIFLTRFGLMGLLPIDLSQKIALKRDSQSSKSSSDDPFQAIFHFLSIFLEEKSTIFPGYSHFISVSHHFHHPPSQLPIEKSQFSIPPT